MAVVRGSSLAPVLDFVEAFAAAAEQVVEAVARSDLRAPVPACPGWTAYDVVAHLGNVHSWAATIVETGQSTEQLDDEPASDRVRVVADWYAGKAGDLYQVLRDADPASECWTFSRFHHTRGFWSRRQTHETLVHLVDLEQAAGRAPVLPARVCADGVAEVLDVFLARMRDRGYPTELAAPLTLRTTDTERAWTLVPVDGGAPAREDGYVDGADVVVAPAPVLLQVLWKRLPADDPALHVTGDADRVLQFLRGRLTP